MKPILKTLFLILLVGSLSSYSPTPTSCYYANYENVLGTSFELKANAVSEKAMEQAEQVALSEIDRLSKILSSYDQTSELSTWQKTLNTDIPVSKELFEVLSLFDHWTEKSNGALNPSVAVAIDAWKKAVISQTLPTEEETSANAAAMKQKHWVLNYNHQTARHLTTYPLVFNTFVKSYIINKATEKVMSVPGIDYAVLNIGGDLKVMGTQHDIVRIANPLASAENDLPLSRISVANKSVATSGNYRRGFKIGNQWYSHILDARTAQPVKEIISATVVADNAIDAGALATTLTILPIAESVALASTLPGVEFYLVTKTGTIVSSHGWKNLEVASNNSTTVETAAAVKAAIDFELQVELELASFEQRAHRPFVAVWVENENKDVIRNLALWYNKPRWLHDLRRWYSKNGDSFMQGPTESVTGATRSAGKYSLKWDGKTTDGKLVPSGTYTIYIEAAREHGTYQLIKKEFEWNNKPSHSDLPSGVEITTASIDLHKI